MARIWTWEDPGVTARQSFPPKGSFQYMVINGRPCICFATMLRDFRLAHFNFNNSKAIVTTCVSLHFPVHSFITDTLNRMFRSKLFNFFLEVFFISRQLLRKENNLDTIFFSLVWQKINYSIYIFLFVAPRKTLRKGFQKTQQVIHIWFLRGSGGSSNVDKWGGGGESLDGILEFKGGSRK